MSESKYHIVNDLFELDEEYKNKRTILFFKGIIRQQLIANFTDNLLKDLTIEDEGVRGKIVGIFIEMSQNVRLHAKEKEITETEKNGRGFISVLEDEYTFSISSTNVIDAKSENLLKARVHYINSLNHEDLREYYRRERRKPKRPNSVGSNIGLIDMARRAENPLMINFRPISEESLLFSLRIFVNKSCLLL